MQAGRAATGTDSERSIIVSRVVNAPPALVWKVLTQPEHVAQWWGPNGFTNTVGEMDVRVGGVWRIVMHGPDGVDYPNRMVFKEVVEPELLVYDHSGEGEFSDHKFEATITLTEHPGGTEVTLQGLFPTARERDESAAAGALEGAHQTLGRLAEYVKRTEEDR